MTDCVTVAVLGSGGVGKTCVILRLTRSTFDTDYVPTISDSFEKNYLYNGKNYKLQIIDTAGQDEMGAITDMAIKDANVFILMYSIISPLSFDEVDKFYDKVKKCTNGTPNIILVGNKCDMSDDRAVKNEQGQSKAQSFGGCPFIECSAKNDINITQVFEKALDLAVGGSSGKKPGKADKSGGGGEGGNGGCCEVA